ncbi:MAG: class II aldolase/adducin family protein [Sphingomonas fennica]
MATMLAEPAPAGSTRIGEEEQALRRQLAEFYHLVAYMGWTELIMNHISVRLPGTDEYLVNPFGLHYTEITPDNLIVVGTDGRLRRPSPWAANPAGFALHGAIHDTRHDVNCIAHVHGTAVSAVCGKKGGFKHDNFYGAQLYGRIGYHRFEGVTLYADERERMIESLGDRHILVLRNHGVAVCERDVATTFMLLWTVHRAAEVQAMQDAMAGEDETVDPAIAERCVADALKLTEKSSYARLAFDAQVRIMRARTAMPF